jgi:redox-sensing transcriptional repressor
MERLPDQTIGRLPVYLRCLSQARSIGLTVVNSLSLAQMAGTNAAQVRKDLSYLGELGIRGIGYDVATLSAHISDVLGLTQSRRVAIVGFGRLGSALVAYPRFAERGFVFAAAFDVNPARVGLRVGEIVVSPIDDIETELAARGIEIAMLATPSQVAQEMAERIVAGGVRAILDFTSSRLELPSEVRVRPVDLASELQVLSFHLARMS